MRALLADDNAAVLAALAEILAADDAIMVVATAATGDEAATLAALHEPDVAVVDLDMAGGGAGLVQRLTAAPAALRVLVFSGRDDVESVAGVLSAGATAFVAKGGVTEDFAELVRRCAAGEQFVSARCAAEVAARLAKP
jgi:two-component system response regulator DesR